MRVTFVLASLGIMIKLAIGGLKLRVENSLSSTYSV